jgi:SNF2 family DNA or RNA helicase
MSEEPVQCPLVTPYTIHKGIDSVTLERLYQVRKWDIERDEAGVIHNPIPFKWPKLLRKTIWDIDNECDSGVTLELRQYQIQMIHHLIRMDKFINGDAVGLGKTLDVVAAVAWLKERNPDAKVVIVTTKSTTYQWRDEFLRFSHIRPFVMKDKYQGLTSSDARQAQMEKFLKGNRKDVIIVKYDSIRGTRKKTTEKFDTDGTPIKGGKEMDSGDVKFFTKIFKEHKDNLILVFDECHRFKGTQTAVRNLVFSIARSAGKVWGLTATVMKNSLNEFYAVATALGICPFGFMPDFVEEFCIMRPQYIGGGRKKMVLVGYQNISKFKAGIRPFFLGRSQRQVKEPLPQLTTVYHPLDLTDQQIDLLDDIKTGVFILPPALIKDKDGDLHEMERDPDNLMTQLSVQQLVANHPALLDPSDLKAFYTTKLSPKEEALLDMLDGDLSGEKVIVFTKYKMWIDRLEKITKSGDFTTRKFLRITGNENEKQRNDNKRLFQGSADHDLIVINAAGIEGINLQQAAHMVLLDVPWSWGDLIQLVGRMVRMASPHSACTLHVLVAKGTIDEYAIETLKGKKSVFEKILGESHSAGILDDKNLILDLESGMEAGNSDDEYRALLKAHVKKVAMKTFLEGEQIDKARGNEDYQMIFQKDSKKTGTRKKKSLPEIDSKWGEIDSL